MGLTSGVLPFHSIEMNKVDMILILHPDFRQCSFQTKEPSFPPNHHDGCVTFCVMQNRNFSTMHVRMEDARENLEIRHVGDAPRRWPARYHETFFPLHAKRFCCLARLLRMHQMHQLTLVQPIYMSNIRQHIQLKRCVRKSKETYLP